MRLDAIGHGKAAEAARQSQEIDGQDDGDKEATKRSKPLGPQFKVQGVKGEVGSLLGFLLSKALRQGHP